MYQEIKDAAQAALDLQNKNFMDQTFKSIIAMCDASALASTAQFAQSGESLDRGDAVKIVAGVAKKVVKGGKK